MAGRQSKSNVYKPSQNYDAEVHNGDYSYPTTSTAGRGHRYPHPATAYGNHALPAPASGAGVASQHVTAAAKLSPRNDGTGVKHRDVPDATNIRGSSGAAAAAAGQRRPADRASAAHRSRPWPHVGGRDNVTGGDAPRERGPRGGGGDIGYGERSIDQTQSFSRRTIQPQAANPASSRVQASSFAGGMCASSESGNPRSRHPHSSVPPGRPKSTASTLAPTEAEAGYPPAEACVNVEAAGDWRLGEPAEARRAMTCEEAEGISAFIGCPLTNCPMHRAQGIGEGWMARHLASHTLLAAEKQRTDEYVTCSVAEVLHEMCSDVEVPPSQRKFGRRQMSRALFNRPRSGLGMVVGLMETKVTGGDDNPLVRRCAYDLANGKCDGLNDPDSIVRCDKCNTWSHISCGRVAIPRGYGGSDENSILCRACLPRIGPFAGEPSGAIQKEEAATVRGKRKEMLRFLERDVASGWPEGVFDLNMSAEDRGSRTGCSADGKRVTERGHIFDGQAKHSNRPPCATGKCELPSRPDSRFCSDGCGVLNAETELAKALRHSLEERGGLDRGRRLLEVKESKIRKTEVAVASRRLGKLRAPALMLHHEEQLHTMVHRRWRLWKRLIEIGAYWEKVSGCKDLLAISTAAKVAAREAGETIEGNAAPGKKKGKGRGSDGGGGGEDVQNSAVEGAKANLVATALAVEDVAKKHVAEIKAAKAAERDRRSGGGIGSEEAGSSLGDLCAKGATTTVTQPAGGGMAVAGGVRGGGDCVMEEAGGASTGKTSSEARQDDAATVTAKTSVSGTLGEEKGAGGQPQADERTGTRGASSEKSSTETAAAGKSGTEGDNPKASTPRPESSSSTHAAPSEAGPPAAAGSTPTPLGDGEADADLDVDVGVEMDDNAVEQNAPAQHLGAVGDGRQVASAAAVAAGAKKAGVSGAAPVGRSSAERPEENSRPAKKLKRVGTPPQGPSREGAGAQPLPLAPPVAVVTVAPRFGVEEMTCAYCGEATGARVTEHLEECYQKVTALRNARLDQTSLRPIVHRPSAPQGGPRSLSAAVAAASADAAAQSSYTSVDGASAVGRQLLGRRVPYADFDALPDPQAFRLHRDLLGWMGSPSRLDFLYKELVRQRNAAITELQWLDRQEAALERHLRQEWMADEIGSVPFARD